MNRTNVILIISAVSVIVGLGVLARVSPAFKAAATDISLTLLVLLVLCGLLGALIMPLLDWWSDPGPQRSAGPPDPATDRSAHHVGAPR
jgi:hypothetical protein